jgi:hypothetical protein
MSEPAKVFEDRLFPGDWRVEWVDDDGGVELAIFAGPNARERALRYADRQYGRFEEGKRQLITAVCFSLRLIGGGWRCGRAGS